MKLFFVQRLTLSTLLTSLVVLIIIGINSIAYFSSASIINEFVEKNSVSAAEKFSGIVSKEFLNQFVGVETAVRNVSLAIEDKDSTTIKELLTDFLNSNPSIYGSTFAYTNMDYAPYLYRHQDYIAEENLAGEEYQYRKTPWFNKPMTTGKPFWSKPYFDEGGGNTYMITYSYPVFEKKSRKIIGVLTADIDILWITQFCNSLDNPYKAYFGLINSDEKIFFDSENSFQTQQTLNIDTQDFNNTVLDIDDDFNGRGKGKLFFSNIGFNDWTLMTFISRSEMKNHRGVLNEANIVFIIGILLSVLLVGAVIRYIAYYIKTISTSVEMVASGDIAQGNKIALSMLEKTKLYKQTVLKEDQVKNEITRLVLAVNSMFFNLEHLILNSKKAGDKVNESAIYLTDESKNIEKAGKLQSNYTEQIAVRTDEMSESINRLEDKLAKITTTAEEVNYDAEKGKDSLETIGTYLGSIDDSTITLKNKLTNLTEQTSSIIDVIHTINNIAHRTNMLAINAEIETEKTASEIQEKDIDVNISGIRVVATQINQLSGETADSARKIEQKIYDINQALDGIIEFLNVYVNQEQESVANMCNARVSLINIIDKTQELTSQFVEFRHSMKDQNESVYSIVDRIDKINSAADGINITLDNFKNKLIDMNNSIYKLQNSLSNFTINQDI